MSAWIIATGFADPSTVETLLGDPAFRKATRNMALAYAAVTDLFRKLPQGWLAEHGPSLSSVLGTSNGELDVTVQFLKIYGGSGLARPFLFQSSLHNATLGFLSERFGWRGPGATICGYDTSGEEAMETAADWVQTMESPFAIAIGVDGLVEGAPQLREGAGAILFARPGATELPVLETYRGWDGARTDRLATYDAGAVEWFARRLAKT